jgi:hypothetical protein
MTGTLRLGLRPSPGGSGPATARLFDRLLAAVFLVAWISLGAQVDVLLGSRGLLPAGAYVEGLHAQGISLLDAPTIFLRLGAGDAALHAGIVAAPRPARAASPRSPRSPPTSSPRCSTPSRTSAPPRRSTPTSPRCTASSRRTAW